MIKRIIPSLFSIAFALSLLSLNVSAKDKTKAIEGKVYQFEKNSKYEISKANDYISTKDADTYGNFIISGNFEDAGNKNHIPSYKIKDDTFSLTYKYDDTYLKAADENVDMWHIIEDKTKTVDNKDIGGEIKFGAIILEISLDGMNWSVTNCATDVFKTIPESSEPFYQAKDIELINGCYYRLTVVYEMRKRVKESNILFITTDKYDYKKCAEVYEFYAFTPSEEEIIGSTYSLGKKVRVDDFNSYSGETSIEEDDPHSGWELGNFYVSGYTQDTTDENGNIVFLKNSGDKVALSFKLNQNIDKLNDNEKLSITADKNGYDKYFEQGPMDFGRGALFIRYTNRYNESEIFRYTNYLEANTSFGTDTRILLFEEGDYEIALDYEITKDDLIDKKSHYRIFFKFSVRNGNCMVYPFDITTNSELTNNSIAENGFRIDLAKSKYLKVNVKREILADSADGLVEDTRFNGPAKEGKEYTDEGIYTITAKNEYTDETTVKRIYVGTNIILKAYIKNPDLSIKEINTLVSKGATLLNDGTIVYIEETTTAEMTPSETTVSEVTTTEEYTDVVMFTDDAIDLNQSDSAITVLISVVIGIAIVSAIIVIVIVFKKKSQRNSKNMPDSIKEE